MRRTIFIIGIMVALFALSPLFAGEAKIAYFDSDRIRNEWDEWKNAQAKFDEIVAKWQDQAQKMEDEIKKMQEEYQRQELMLSEEKRIEKQRLIQEKQQKYQEFLASIFGQGGKADQKNQELTKPLYEKINRALTNIANKYGYTVIFDINGSSIAYIDPSLDITDELLQELKTEK